MALTAAPATSATSPQRTTRPSLALIGSSPFDPGVLRRTPTPPSLRASESRCAPDADQRKRGAPTAAAGLLMAR